jgi:NADP-dependent alcohol dehydrogenase
MIAYGGGSIRRKCVYDRVRNALAGRPVFEFGGIEPNPQYETLMRAVEQARAGRIDFLLAVGGGSVLDGAKFMAAAVPFAGDPWNILTRKAAVLEALPLGAVLTLPATGSEMNLRASTEKRGNTSGLLKASFSFVASREITPNRSPTRSSSTSRIR